VIPLTIETLVYNQQCTSSVWGYFPRVTIATNLRIQLKRFARNIFKETDSLPKPVRIADSTTSSLFSHLHVRHAEVHSQLKVAMDKAKQHSATSSEIPSKQQPKMDAFIKNNLYSWGSIKRKSLTNSTV